MAAPAPASAADPAPGAAAIAARIAAAHIKPPRAEAVIVDLAADPPLGRSLLDTTLLHADRIVAATGAAMVAARAKRVVIAVRDVAAHNALAAAAKSAAATSLTIERVADVWPIAGLDRELAGDARGDAWLLSAAALFALEAAAFSRAPIPPRVTVAGEVKSLRSIALDSQRALSIEALVALAGGAVCEPWVALDGGAWAGRIADPELPPRTPLLLILPAGHALVGRARVSLDDHLRRAASACEGCRACTDVCPPFLDGLPLEPHALVAALATGHERIAGAESAAACIGCGVCSAACPSALDPFALIGAIKTRLPANLPLPIRGAPHPDRATRRLSSELLLLRAGLAAPATSR